MYLSATLEGNRSCTKVRLAQTIVDFAVKLHENLGPGLLESVCEAVLAKQLQLVGLTIHRQVPTPIIYEGIAFDEGLVARKGYTE